jgi:coenzyme F420-reducing hydrogenase beta subunit
MKEGEDGFYYPHVNENCTHCGSCQNHCPVINLVENDFFEPKFYAGWSTDETRRMTGSSGGIFSELAKYVLENSGVVFGVAWSKELIPRHIKVAEIGETLKIMGSKYVQSYVGLSYKEAIEEAEKRTVLFSGTPCQIAALKTFFRDRSNVIGIDLVCHGVPSNLVFRKYIDWLERRYGKKVLNVSFRDKKFGWENYNIVIKFEDGSELRRHHHLDPFFACYLSNLYLRQSCYSCPFCRIPRVGDITLGDFWGVPKRLRDRRGISVIIANTSKGYDLLRTIYELDRIKLVEVSQEIAIKGNPRINTGKLIIPWKKEVDFVKKSYEDYFNKFNKPAWIWANKGRLLILNWLKVISDLLKRI